MKIFYCMLIVLTAVVWATAQDQLINNIQQQYHYYESFNLQEKLFVHTDKNFYIAGETVWFKVYSVDASFHKPFTSSSIAYIEILNKDQKPVLQTKITLNMGSGYGSFILPGSIGSGNYNMRAYTNWMKNFSSDFYYEQTLYIVNTLKLTATDIQPKSFYTIQFFPEGGRMVTGFNGKIAFKTSCSDGSSPDCNGIILNDHNDTIVRFQSRCNGMGNFHLKPEKAVSYYAVVKLNNVLIKQKLPVSSETGVVMTVSNVEEDILAVDVQASSDFNNTNLYLFTHSRQILKNVQSNPVREGQSHFILNKKELADGISSITLFDSQRQPLCERLIFKRPSELLLIHAKTDQSVYDTRKPVILTISSTSGDNTAVSGNLSMSVFLTDSLQRIPEQNIVYYLYLNSDLRGPIRFPEYYFTHKDKESDEAIDNLLLTQGWRRFKWSDVFNFRKPAFEFLPELEGPVVNGKVINKLTGTPVGNSVAYLSIPGADYAFSCATSDTGGLIHFGFKGIYKNNVLVLQPALKKDSNYRIDFISAFSDKYSANAFNPRKISKNNVKELTSHSIENQVENTYVVGKKRQYAVIDRDTTSFYGKPDRLYYLEDYTRFQTMEEVMREFVEDVRVRKEGEHFTIKVRNRLFGTYFEESPLILLDGIPISDASKIIALDPLKIKKIEVVTHKYYIGSSVFEGIVNVKSFSGEMGMTQLDPNALVVEYEGLQQQREFYSPAYNYKEMEASHIPDYRNVLYWAPQIFTGADGKTQLNFFTSDLKGTFSVVLQGITNNGLPGKTVIQFEVRDLKK